MNKLKFFIFILFILAVSFFAVKINAQENSNTEIAISSEYVFNTASTSDNVIATLSDDRFVIAYKDGGGDFNKGTVAIGQVSDNIISFGSEYVFNSVATNYISIAPISESKFIIAYQDAGNYNYGTVIIGQVSDNIISFGSEYVFNTADTEHISVSILSSDKFVISYKDISNLGQGTAVIGEIFGNEISFGLEYIFNTSSTNHISSVFLSESKFALAYQDSSNYNYGMAVIGNVSNKSIDFGSEYIFNNAETNYISIDAFSNDKFVIAYRDVSVYYNYGTAIIGQVSDNVISFGLEYVFNPSATSYVSVSFLSQNMLAVSYQSLGGLKYGYVAIGQVSDNIISFGSEYVFNTAVTNYILIHSLAENNFVVAYQSRNGGTNYGTAIIGSILIEEQSVAEEEIIEQEIIATGLSDGDLVRNPNAEGMAQFDIYIIKLINNKKFKRLIISPHVFESYAHFDKNGNGSPWDDVIDIDQDTMHEYTISELVRADGDTKVYKLTPDGDSGVKQLLNMTIEEFSDLYDSDSIYIINNIDRNAYTDAS
ncbi:hypothetical protein ACFLZ0_01160 [Patescibacteria group bacterium]